jgi:hypothetical protein
VEDEELLQVLTKRVEQMYQTLDLVISTIEKMNTIINHLDDRIKYLESRKYN